jgi:hypothetical protein
MKSSSAVIGLILLVGSFLTAIWGFKCPKYFPSRDVYWTPVERTSYWTSFGGNARQGDRTYSKMDLGAFLAGEIIIWGSLWGGYFLLRAPRTGESRD